jgi:hypothetical protein
VADLINRLDGVDDIDQLRAILQAYRTPGDPTITTPGDPTITTPGDPTITTPGDPTITRVLYGSPLVGDQDPGDPTITRSIDDDDQYIDQTSVDHHQSSQEPEKRHAPIDALLSLRGINGNQFSRQTAQQLLGKAMQRFGPENAAAVIFGWVEHARTNSAIANPPGFVRYKIESGELPPEPAEPEPSRNHRIPQDVWDIIQR